MSQKTTLVLHTILQRTSTDFGIFGRVVAERVRCQKMICYLTYPDWCFCTTWGNINTNPENRVFSVIVYTVSRDRHRFGLLYLRHSSTNFNIFIVNKAVLLSTVCKYYFSPSRFVFETRYTAWLKRHDFWGSETLVRKGGITNHCSIA